MPDRKNQSISQKQRMAPEHLFQFNCHTGVPCFTQCCRDVTIVLTPYDLLRLKNSVGIRSEAFLDQYTLVIPKEGHLIPMVVLRMREDDRRCPFVSEEGCSVYEDRPWPCRMYPLSTEGDGTFHIVAPVQKCFGLKEAANWKVGEWLEGQGITPYEEMNELLSTITIPLQVLEPQIDNPQVAKMVFMSLYNLDRFRDFVFKSSFLNRLEVEDLKQIEEIKTNDLALLRFAFDWIKFGVFGEKLFWVKQGIHDEPGN